MWVREEHRDGGGTDGNVKNLRDARKKSRYGTDGVPTDGSETRQTALTCSNAGFSDSR